MFFLIFLFFSFFAEAKMEIDVYGFVKVDLLTADRIVGNLGEIFPPLVPLDDDCADLHSQTIIDARSSRIGVKATDEICDIKMKGVIEGDFFTVDGDARAFNGRHFRLRLAYAKAEDPSGFFLLAGQYWTLPMGDPEIPSLPNANSNITPVGTPISRQPQIRVGYKKKIDDTSSILLEASIEKHAFNRLGFLTITGGDTAQGTEQRFPLLAGKITWLMNALKWNVSFAGTESEVIFDSKGHKRDRYVWLAVTTASYKWNCLTLYATLHRTHGLNRIFSSFLFDLVLDDAFHLHCLDATGGTVGLRLDFIENILWTDIIYGWDFASNKSIIFDETRKKYQDFRLNVFYKFWEHWQLALEYQKVLVETYNKKHGSVNAIHLGIWYFFGES